MIQNLPLNLPHDPLNQRMADTNSMGYCVWIGGDYSFKIDVKWHTKLAKIAGVEYLSMAV